MSNARFDVVYTGGVIERFDIEKVKINFAKLFSLQAVEVEEIFACERIILKPNVDKATAKKYQRALAAVGVVADVENKSAKLKPVTNNIAAKSFRGSVENSRKVVEDSCEVAEDNCEVIEDSREVVENNWEVVENNWEVAESSSEAVENNWKVAEDSSEVIEDSREVVENNWEAAEGDSEVVEDSQEVAEDSGEVIEDNQEVVENNWEAAEGGSEVVKDSQEVAEDNGEVIEDNQEVVENNWEVAEGGSEVIEDSQEVAEGSGEVIEDNQEAVENNWEVVEDSGEVIEDSQEVAENCWEVVENSEEAVENNWEVAEDNWNIAENSWTVTDNNWKVAKNNWNLAESSWEVAENNWKVADNNWNIAENNTVESREFTFRFIGDGFEYCKIWALNVLLTVLTLGIYSAWAKVSSKQYFYRNTLLNNVPFEYLANPVDILKGRIIVTGLLVIYLAVSSVHAVGGGVVGLLLLLFLPWLILTSLTFNAHNSAYRNVRFRCNGSLHDAGKIFIGWPLLGILSAGLLLPLALYKQRQFLIESHSYGSLDFKFIATVKDYYLLCIIVVGCAIASSAVVYWLGTVGLPLMSTAGIAICFFLFAFYAASRTSQIYNSLVLGKHRFQGFQDVKPYIGLFITNAIGIVITFGLFIPFAKVRMAKYKAGHMQLVAQGNLDGVIATEQEQLPPLARQINGRFDLEFGL